MQKAIFYSSSSEEQPKSVPMSFFLVKSCAVVVG